LRSIAVQAPAAALSWLQLASGASIMLAGSALALRVVGLPRAPETVRPNRSCLLYLLFGASLLLPVAKLSDWLTAWLQQNELCRECSRHVLRGASLSTVDVLQLFVLGVLVSALCEELMFREVVLMRLRRVTSRTLASLLSASAFALCHPTIVASLQALLLGLCLGAVRVTTRTVAPSVWVHAGFNLALAAIALCFPMQVGSAVPERAADLPLTWVLVALFVAASAAWPLLFRARFAAVEQA
jgi:membrane protease YdiL (CAAX protease family)